MSVANEYVYLLKRLNIFPQVVAFAMDRCRNMNWLIDHEDHYDKVKNISSCSALSFVYRGTLIS
jgi:hypothetical protein